MADTRDAALLPCPRCGVPAQAHAGAFGDWWTIQCTAERCRLHLPDAGETEAKAIEAWNRRTPPAGPTVWLARDMDASLPMLYAERPMLLPGGHYSGTLAVVGAIPDPIASILHIEPGSCAPFRLARVDQEEAK